MKTLISLMLSLLLTTSVFAQEQAGSGSENDLLKNTQTDIMIVGGAGVAGAILGLSTLSFVDKPADHLSNIWTGAALGVIAGVLFVAYNSAAKGSEELQSEAQFNTSERTKWHALHAQNLTFEKVQFGTQFWTTSF